MNQHGFPRYFGHLEIDTPNGKFLDDRRVRLLESIVLAGSISRAARRRIAIFSNNVLRFRVETPLPLFAGNA
jgi:hypothetical protein